MSSLYTLCRLSLLLQRNADKDEDYDKNLLCLSAVYLNVEESSCKLVFSFINLHGNVVTKI